MILLGLEIKFTFASDSLKDKRRILQSMMKKVADKYGVSVAETGDQDLINQARIGIGMVSNSYSFAEKMLNQAVDFCENHYPIEVISKDWYE